MSILKHIATTVGAVAALSLIMFAFDHGGYKRGKADAEAACAEQSAADYSAQLAEVVRLNSATLEAVSEGQREAAQADRKLLASAASLSSAFKELAREDIIPVLADCRRSYDAVRLYQRAASGASTGDREVDATAGVPVLGDGALHEPGDALDN